MAFGGEVGKDGGQLSEQPLGGGQCRFGLGQGLIDAAALFEGGFDLVLYYGFL